MLRLAFLGMGWRELLFDFHGFSLHLQKRRDYKICAVAYDALTFTILASRGMMGFLGGKNNREPSESVGLAGGTGGEGEE